MNFIKAVRAKRAQQIADERAREDAARIEREAVKQREVAAVEEFRRWVHDTLGIELPFPDCEIEAKESANAYTFTITSNSFMHKSLIRVSYIPLNADHRIESDPLGARSCPWHAEVVDGYLDCATLIDALDYVMPREEQP